MKDAKAKRDRHLRICRDLRQKTVENGCTEAEAIAAAEKLAQLMRDFDLTFEDLGDTPSSEFVRHDRKVEDDVDLRLHIVGRAIANLCGVRMWVDVNGPAMSQVTFFGRDTDVEVASYLLQIADRAMRDGLAQFRPTVALYRPPLRRAKQKAFLDGMATSLNRSINEIHWRQQRTGTGLIVLKQDMVDAEMAKRKIELEAGRSELIRDFDRSFDQGVARGESVLFNAGVTGPVTDADVIEEESSGE